MEMYVISIRAMFIHETGMVMQEIAFYLQTLNF
jgi:hypothetical protein